MVKLYVIRDSVLTKNQKKAKNSRFMANSLKGAKSIYLTFSPFEFCNFVVVLLLPLLLVLLITFILVSPLMSMLGDTLGEGGELLGPDDPDSLSPLALACN